MATSNRIAEVAAAVGEPARAAMLAALMDGRALTASELAEVVAVTPQTASGHLARLASVGLIAAEKQGRHRYHRLASPDVAWMIESVMQIAGRVALARPPHRVASPRHPRVCWKYAQHPARSAAPVWTGASAAHIWLAFWAPPSASMRWIRAGSSVALEHGRWKSLRQAVSVSGNPSGLK